MPTVISGTYAGSIPLNGEDVALDSDFGKRFVFACTLHDEALLSAADLRLRFDLTEGAWDDLKFNRSLQRAVRELLDERKLSGLAGTQKAQAYSGPALDTLRDIHRDSRQPASARGGAAATILKHGGVGGGGGMPGRAPSGGPWVNLQLRTGDRVTVSKPPPGVEPTFAITTDFSAKLEKPVIEARAHRVTGFDDATD